MTGIRIKDDHNHVWFDFEKAVHVNEIQDVQLAKEVKEAPDLPPPTFAPYGIKVQFVTSNITLIGWTLDKWEKFSVEIHRQKQSIEVQKQLIKLPHA